MAEPEQILQFLGEQVFKKGALQGKKALVTAGPTYEPIDPVRFIGNHSSGKMGMALANCRPGKPEVTLVLGPVGDEPELPGIKIISVMTAAQMYEACLQVFPASDMAIMAAAVADYTPVQTAVEKIKKTGESLPLELKKTRDILKCLGEIKTKDQVLVGFALETNEEKKNALAKLETKNADIIGVNLLNDAGAGFGKDTNKVTLFTRDGKEFPFDTKSKQAVAADITDTIIQLYYAK